MFEGKFVNEQVLDVPNGGVLQFTNAPGINGINGLDGSNVPYGAVVNLADLTLTDLADPPFDNSTVIQTVMDTLAASGGGLVLLPATSGQVCGWAGELLVPLGVTLVGQGKGYDEESAGTCLRAADDTATIKVGQFDGTNNRPGGIRGMLVSGGPDNEGLAGIGERGGMVVVQGVETAVSDMAVRGAGGRGLVVDTAQNIHFDSVDVDDCVEGGLVLTGGAGGLLFSRCELRSNGVDLFITDDGVARAYPFGPAHIKFDTCIFETYAASDALVRIECGANIQFAHCGFSNNNPNGGSLVADALVEVSNPHFPTVSTFVELSSCNFNGGSTEQVDAVRIMGANVVGLNGENYFQQHDFIFTQDGGTGVLRNYGVSFYGGGIGSKRQVIGGGSDGSWLVDKEASYRFTVPTGKTPVSWREEGDAGLRGWLNSSELAFGDGSGFTGLGRLGFDSANDRFYFTKNMTGGLLAEDFEVSALRPPVPGGTAGITAYAQGSTWYGGYVNNIAASANTDVITLRLPNPLRGGTWTLVWLHWTGNNRAIYTIETSIDNVTWTALTTVDGYQASATVTRTVVTGLTVVDGSRFIRARMATRNASNAAGWVAALSGCSGYRTGS